MCARSEGFRLVERGRESLQWTHGASAIVLDSAERVKHGQVLPDQTDADIASLTSESNSVGKRSSMAGTSRGVSRFRGAAPR